MGSELSLAAGQFVAGVPLRLIRLPGGAPLLFIRTVVARDWQFLSFTVLACVVAATVATFQYSVFTSFLRAGAVIPRTVGADFWIIATSVECFDFPDPIAEDYAQSAQQFVPGATYRRVVFGFAPWRSPRGKRGNVAVVGIDGLDVSQTSFIADRSDLSRLDIAESPQESEATIGRETLTFSHSVTNLPTFLGAPYVMLPFDKARHVLGIEAGTTAFLIGNFGPGEHPDLTAAQAAMAKDYPEVTLISADDFSRSSSLYWQKKTGAGAAILLAAILAALLMVILLANGISRFIQRHHEDLLSLLGHGASEREISKIITGVSIMIALATLVAALILTPIVLLIANPLLPWTAFEWEDIGFTLGATTVALLIAALSSRRAIAAYGPDAVFRS